MTGINPKEPTMYVLAVLICPRSTSHSDHEVDTRSGEAECVGCGHRHTVEPTELLALLEDA